MAIIIHELEHRYEDGSAGEKVALHDVNIKIEQGEMIGLIGHTGSGKSTLIQHLNGLLKPTSGAVFYDGKDINDSDFSKKKLRSKVGLVFQYPEYQLFESTVIDDVKFGPKNIGMDSLKIDMNSFQALKQVGIGEDLLDVSPLELSGGQKRRVAIAGVLAMEPEVLILDEPTAGLDPEERLRFYNLLSELAVERIILLSTHIASDIEATCSKAAVLSSGTVVFEGQIEKLLQLGNGKVYTTTILQNELNQFKQKYRVISIYQNGINVSCRFLSNAAPKKEWVSCQPTIEDSYMYLLSSFKQEVE